MEKSPSGFEAERYNHLVIDPLLFLFLLLIEFSRIGICVMQQRTNIYYNSIFLTNHRIDNNQTPYCNAL
jgi:hypothetical protein